VHRPRLTYQSRTFSSLDIIPASHTWISVDWGQKKLKVNSNAWDYVKPKYIVIAGRPTRPSLTAAVGATPTLPLVVGFFRLSVFLSCPTPWCLSPPGLENGVLQQHIELKNFFWIDVNKWILIVLFLNFTEEKNVERQKKAGDGGSSCGLCKFLMGFPNLITKPSL
jgi:hypothetical protein